jgi:prepilin-type processing-associated H-X9-DG protein
MSLADSPFSAPIGVQTVACSADGSELRVTLATGEPMTINAATLRAACRRAHCRRAQVDGDIHASFDGIIIADVAWVGGYGVNVTFSDGHARGIFPFVYLIEIAAGRGEPPGSAQPTNPLILQDLV